MNDKVFQDKFKKKNLKVLEHKQKHKIQKSMGHNEESTQHLMSKLIYFCEKSNNNDAPRGLVKTRAKAPERGRQDLVWQMKP